MQKIQFRPATSQEATVGKDLLEVQTKRQRDKLRKDWTQEKKMIQKSKRHSKNRKHTLKNKAKKAQ